MSYVDKEGQRHFFTMSSNIPQCSKIRQNTGIHLSHASPVLSLLSPKQYPSILYFSYNPSHLTVNFITMPQKISHLGVFSCHYDKTPERQLEGGKIWGLTILEDSVHCGGWSMSSKVGWFTVMRLWFGFFYDVDKEQEKLPQNQDWVTSATRPQMPD